MPISIEELEAAQRPLADRIVERLGADPANAFSARDLFLALYFQNDLNARMIFALAALESQQAAMRPVVDALTSLTAAGMLRQADYNGTLYYTLKGKK